MNKGMFKISLFVICFVFIVSYVISEVGYYEYTMRQRSVITNEKIKQFEDDIKNNKELDMNGYLDKENISYSNKITNLVYYISDNSNKLARKVIKIVFKKLGSLVEE